MDIESEGNEILILKEIRDLLQSVARLQVKIIKKTYDISNLPIAKQEESAQSISLMRKNGALIKSLTDQSVDFFKRGMQAEALSLEEFDKWRTVLMQLKDSLQAQLRVQYEILHDAGD